MRLILIDNHTGYIYGDTADIGGRALDLVGTDRDCAIEAARALDISIEGDRGLEYEFSTTNPRDTSAGYHVYRADIGGSEAVGLVTDGQDQEMIEAVESECEYLGFVRSFREANEGHQP